MEFSTKGRVQKKKLVKFSTKKKEEEKKHGLKTPDLAYNHFKTNLFFSIFGWGDLSQPGSWSEWCLKPLKLSREDI